jgi:non-specific serine/threonine protein kinase
VWAHITASWLAHVQGDYEAANQLAQSSVALARKVSDGEVLAFALYQSSATLSAQGKLDAAGDAIEEAAALLEGSANHRLVSAIKSAMALVATQSGDYKAALAIQRDAVALARAGGAVVLIAGYLDNLGWAQLGMNDYDAAAVSWKEAVSISASLNYFVGLIVCFEGLSCVASGRHNDHRALRLAASANRRSAERSITSEPWVRKQVDGWVALSRSRLGVRESEHAWNQGWAMTMEQAIDYALHDIEPTNVVDADPLTRREREVAGLVAAGLTNRQIAEHLFIAERSAEGHVERIRNKLGVRSRTEVATWAVEHGLKASPIKERGTRPESLSS